MNDGQTALPVSPVTEEEAMSISGMFRKAADAVVNASAMPRQIAELQSQVQALTEKVQTSQSHAQMLDQQLIDMREARNKLEDELVQQRNRYEDELAQARGKIAQLEQDLAYSGREIERKAAEFASLSSAHQQATKDRDDYGLRAMQLEDELGVAKATLSDIQAKVSALFPTPTPVTPTPEPTPVPEVTAPSPTEPEPSPTSWGSQTPDDGPRYEDQLPASSANPPPY